MFKIKIIFKDPNQKDVEFFEEDLDLATKIFLDLDFENLKIKEASLEKI